MENGDKCYVCKQPADIDSEKGPICMSCFQSLEATQPKTLESTNKKEEKGGLKAAPEKPNTGFCSICKKQLDAVASIESDIGFVCMECFSADAQEENERNYNPLTNRKHLNFLIFNIYHEEPENPTNDVSFLSARYLNIEKEDPSKVEVLEISSNQTALPTTIPEYFSSVVPLSEYQFLITGGSVKTPAGYVPASMFLGVAVHKSNHYFSFGPLNNMSQSRFAHSSIIVNNYLYVLGGLQRVAKDNTYCWLNSCEKFNLEGLKLKLDIVLETGDRSELPTHDWEAVEKMNNARANLGVFEAGGKIYAFGGFSGANVLESSIERYDPAQNKWEILDFKEKLAKINSTFLASSLVLNIDEQVFILGGTDGAKASNQAIRIDTKTMELESLKPLKNARAGARGFALINTLYLFGGETPSKEGNAPLFFEILDLSKKNEGFQVYRCPDEVNKDSGILGTGFVGDYGFFISSYKF